MKLQNMGHVVGVPSEMFQQDPSSQYSLMFSTYSPNEPLLAKLRAKITEAIKMNLRISVKLFRLEYAERIFEQQFSVKEGEKLIKASQCRISTTAGLILGRLFISTHKVTFCSVKSIRISSEDRDRSEVYYKVVIPVGKLSRASVSGNMKTPSEKYIEIVTVDNFDFWFVGVHSYRKTLKYLLQSLTSMDNSNKC